jgi:RND family efflux transporter MFP subunit
VRPGDLVAELDPTDYEIQAQQAEQSLRRSRAEARNAAANYERVRLLYENNNASLNDLDAAQARAESADAAVGAAEKNLQLVKLKLGYTRLKAPIAGSIATVDVEVNENVRQGQAVAVLQAGSKPEVLVSIPEVLITEIEEGSRVEVTCDAMPGKLLLATVSEVGVTSGGMQTAFPVTVQLDEADPDIRPGMAAEVAFSFESAGPTELYLVPPVAVGEDRDGRFVFVARPTGGGRGVVERRPVEVGELTGLGLEVLEGLQDGDLLVTAGVSRIEDGLEVKLPDPTEDRP